MNAPISSIVTLFAEIIIAAIIFYIIYLGYYKNLFFKKLAIFTIIYEIVFNVGYMVYKTISQPTSLVLSPPMKIFAILHGILSLVMLFAVIIFFLKAIKRYALGENYFKQNKLKTFLFIFFWLISILSGIFLFVSAYIL